MLIKKILFLIKEYFLHLLLVPLFMTLAVYFIGKEDVHFYKSSMIVYTGLTSNNSIVGAAMKNSSLNPLQIDNAYSNLLSITTSHNSLEILALHLLTTYIKLEKQSDEMVSEKYYQKIKKSIPSYISKMADTLSHDEMFSYLYNSVVKSDTSWAGSLINSSRGFFSIVALSSIEFDRISKSDLVEVSFTTVDPGVARTTLEVFNRTFIEEYKSIKNEELKNINNFFEENLVKLEKKLHEKEDSLLKLKERYNIIDLGIETAKSSTQKDNLEQLYLSTKLNLAAAKSVLDEVEKRFKHKDDLLASNPRIRGIKDKIVNISTQMVREQLMNNSEENENLLLLEQSKEQIEELLADQIEKLNVGNLTSISIDQRVLVEEWLNKYVEYEALNAQNKVLEQRLSDFSEKYQNFAPITMEAKRLERDISLISGDIEQLENGLRRSNLFGRNLEQSFNMVVVDDPVYPEKPIKATLKLNLVFAYSSSLFLLLLIIYLREVNSPRLHLFTNYKKLEGVDFIGNFPDLNKKNVTPEDVERIENIMVLRLLSDFQKTGKLSYNVLVASHYDNSGKRFIAQRLADVIKLKENIDSGITTKAVGEMVIFPLKDGCFFHILPSFNNKIMDPALIGEYDAILFILKKGMEWTYREKQVMENLKSAFPGKVKVILNFTDLSVF